MYVDIFNRNTICYLTKQTEVLTPLRVVVITSTAVGKTAAIAVICYVSKIHVSNGCILHTTEDTAFGNDNVVNGMSVTVKRTLEPRLLTRVTSRQVVAAAIEVVCKYIVAFHVVAFVPGVTVTVKHAVVNVAGVITLDTTTYTEGLQFFNRADKLRAYYVEDISIVVLINANYFARLTITLLA